MAAHQAPRPWHSPDKNTGVGCHFLLQCMKVKSEREVAQSCSTLSNLMDCSLPGSSVHGIFQARVLEWGAIAFSECDLKEGYKNHLGDSLPPLYAECLCWELCNLLLFNKSYSVTTMCFCMFMNSILWLRGQELGFLSHLLGACLEVLNAYSR